MAGAGGKKRGRWIVRAILGIVAVCFLFVVLPFLSIRVPVVRSWLLDRSLHGRVLSPDWSLRIDSVDRFDPWGLRMQGLHLIYRGPEGDQEYASLGRLELRWDPRDLLRHRIWARQIGCDSLDLHTDVPAPTFIASEVSGADAGRESLRLPWLRLESFGLGFRILTDRIPLASGSVSLHGLEHQDGRLHGTVAEVLLTYHPDTLTVRLEGGEILGSLTSAIGLRKAKVTLEGVMTSSISGDVTLPQEDRQPFAATLVCEIDRFYPSGLVMLRRLGAGFAERDSLQGMLRLEFGPEVSSARLEASGRLFDGVLSSLTLLASHRGDTLEIHDVGLDHRAGALSGEGRYLLSNRRLHGRADVRRINLADRSLASWLPGMPRTSLSGELRGEARFDTAGAEATVFGNLVVSEIFGRSPGPVSFGVRLHQRRVTIDSLRVGTPGTGFFAQGWWAIDTGLCEATAHLGGVRLDDWVEPFVGIGFAGTSRGTLSLNGEISSPHIRGNLDVERFSLGGIIAERVQVDSICGRLVPPRFDGLVAARGIDLYGVAIDTAAFTVDWDERLVVRAVAKVDTISAIALVEITPAEPGSLLVRSLRLAPGCLPEWRSTREGRILWRTGSVMIDDVRLESADGMLAGSLALGADRSRLDGHVHVDDLNLLGIERFLGLADSSLAGLCDLDVTLGGTPESPSLQGRIDGRQILAARWPVGSLDAKFSISEDGTIRIDSLHAGTIEGAGSVAIPELTIRPRRPLPLLLESVGDSLQECLERTDLQGRINIDGLLLSRIVKTALRAAPGERGVLFAEPRDPMMSRIRTVHEGREREGAGIADEVGGVISCELELAGNAASPRVSVRGGLHDFRLYQARADSVLFALSYRPRVAVLDSLVWHRGGRASRAEGSLPIMLHPSTRRVELLQTEPISLDAQLPEIDLAILGVVSRQITDPEGFLSGEVALRGTPEHFWPEGSLSIRDGGIRIPNREERIYGINGALTLDSMGVTIDSLVGRMGENGRLAAWGTFRDWEDFYLEGELRGVTAYDTELYYATFDADLRAFPIESLVGTDPMVIGSVDVLEGAIIGDPAKAAPPAGRPGKEPSSWRAEIDIYAPGNMRWDASGASIEMGEAENLHLSFDDPELNISGGIRVLGGRYRLFNSVFTITSGDVIFRDIGGGAVEPILDIYADTNVNVYTPGVSDFQTERVTIHVSGSTTAPKFELSSESDLADDEILTLLSIGRLRGKEGQIGVADPSKQYLFTEIVSQIESEISRLVTPLQNVSVRPGEEPGAAWQLNVRQTVLPQVSFVYTRDLANTADQEVSVHYNLRGQLYLNAAVERRQEEGALADRYLLDLKMRFEYK